MKDFIFNGGVLIISVLSGLLVIIVALSIFRFISFFKKTEIRSETDSSYFSRVRSIGLLAMVLGILHQLIGFYIAFSAIAIAGDVAPSLFFKGLKLSFIPTIYGLSIYLFSILICLTMDFTLSKKHHD